MEPLQAQITNILQNFFSLSHFREGQREVIEHTLRKKNSLLLMPTGGGKSLCFQIPALIFDGLTLVISPLIALMEDQARALQKKGIRAEALHSNIKKSKRINVMTNIDNLSLLYVSPERFRDHTFLQAVQQTRVAFLVIDEAHCISQWGYDFRSDYLRIPEFAALLKNPVIMAVTATATKRVQKDMLSVLGFCESTMPIFDYGKPRKNLCFDVKEVIDQSQKFVSMLKEISSRQKQTGIIYFTLIKNLKKFSEYLQEKQIAHAVFHGQLNAKEKQKVYRLFASDTPLLLLATNAFGMGVDRPDIRFIIHAEIPDSVEAYVQESGRAGRDEKKSDCLLYFCQDDLAVQMDFLEWKFPPAYFIEQTFRFLKAKPLSQHWDYRQLQEKMVYKNKNDHRLQSSLLLLERYAVTSGSLENFDLEVIRETLPDNLKNQKFLDLGKEEAQQRLVSLVRYVRTAAPQRKTFLKKYFS